MKSKDARKKATKPVILRSSLHPSGAPYESLSNDQMQEQFLKILARLEPQDAKVYKAALLSMWRGERKGLDADFFNRLAPTVGLLGAIEDLHKNVWSALHHLKTFGFRINQKNEKTLLEALYRIGTTPIWRNRKIKNFPAFIASKIRERCRRYEVEKGRQKPLRSEHVHGLIYLDSKQSFDGIALKDSERTEKALLASEEILQLTMCLSPQQKQIVLLDAYGLSDAETARLLKTTHGTVRNQKSVARKKISRRS